MARSYKSLLFGGAGGRTQAADVGLLLLRLFTGLALAFGHGIGKLPPSAGFVERTGSLGFPIPEFFAWAAGLAEFGGGLLLALGLMTRPASFFIGFTMLVAAFGRHAADPFGQKEKALLYLAIAMLYLLIGAGRYSVDHWLGKKSRGHGA